MRYIGFLVSMAISGLFLYLAFRKSDWGAIGSIFTSLNYSWYIVSLTALVLHLYLKSLRWQFILSSLKPITIGSAFANITIGLLANNLLPMRAGELVRLYSMAKTGKMSQSAIFSMLIVERIFDGYCLVLFLAIGFFSSRVSFAPSFDSLIRKACLAAFVIYSAVLMALIGIKRHSLPLFRRFQKNKNDHRIINFLHEKLGLFVEGLKILKGLRSIIIVSGLSLLIWLSFVASTYFTMFMFKDHGKPMSHIVGISGNIALQGIVSIGTMIPSSPGFFGTYEWFSKSFLISYGINEPAIDSFVIFSHASGYLWITLIGLLMFFRSHLSYKTIREQFRRKPSIDEKYDEERS